MLFSLVVIAASFGVGLSYIEEFASENREHDRPCDGYQILKWTALFSKDSQYLLGSLYSRGTCFAQDIPRAKDLYASVYGNDSERVARALFHDAIQLADFYERTQKDPKTEYVRALLRESKSLGFKPSERESRNLIERELMQVFVESLSKR